MKGGKEDGYVRGGSFKKISRLSEIFRVIARGYAENRKFLLKKRSSAEEDLEKDKKV